MNLYFMNMKMLSYLVAKPIVFLYNLYHKQWPSDGIPFENAQRRELSLSWYKYRRESTQPYANHTYYSELFPCLSQADFSVKKT